MLRRRAFSSLVPGILGLALLAGVAHAQEPELAGTLTVMPLPGGLPAALAVIDDPLPPDRGQFLIDLIRRVHQTAVGGRSGHVDPFLRRLLDHLNRAAREVPLTGTADTLPLPLNAGIWNTAVFGEAVAPEALAAAILASRGASLLYSALLSLDEGTRAWLETEPELVADLGSRHAAAFLIASPGVRFAGSALQVPGGQAAEPAWHALVGRPVNEPAAFLRALLSQRDGRLAYFLGEMGQLSSAELRVALNLDAATDAARVESLQRLYGVFERIVPGWRIDDRPYWRPFFDPVTLMWELRADGTNLPRVPGTRAFWRAALLDVQRARNLEIDPRLVAEDGQAEFVWLCEQVFTGEHSDQQRRYQLVLFASRILIELTPQTALDAIEAVRAAGTYPALVASLERAGLTDVALIAGAARRAARLSAIRDEPRAVRALVQFQGTLALLLRGATRGSVPRDALPALVSSLSAVDVGDRGDYEGRLAGWLDTFLREPPTSVPSSDSSGGLEEEPDQMDGHLLRLLAGPPEVPPHVVEWEGTRYRIDLAGAESIRLSRLIEEHTRACLAFARMLVAVAEDLTAAAVTREAVSRVADALEQIAKGTGLESGAGWEQTDVPVRYRQVAEALRRSARTGDLRSAARLAPAVRLLADDLLARAVLELTYAVALGQHQMISAPVSDIARRHDFALRTPAVGHLRPWRLPMAGAETAEGWRVTGSLLGLDVTLADFWLRRVSSKPPPRRPSLNPGDRRVFVDAVALVDPGALTDADRRTIVTAIGRGRARLAAIRTPQDGLALADDVRLSAPRRSVLSWIAAYDPARLASFLSPRELLLLGLEEPQLDPRLHAWGAPGMPRLGCLCLRLLERRPREMVAGRWNSGMLASAFPDLNLRLAELLEGLGMPSSLLAPVLAAATVDFVNSASSRDRDDYRGLVEFLHALGPERVEEYLALLTTAGPLVPVSGSAAPASPREGR